MRGGWAVAGWVGGKKGDDEVGGPGKIEEDEEGGDLEVDTDM